jgi:hypothetical protein
MTRTHPNGLVLAGSNRENVVGGSPPGDTGRAAGRRLTGARPPLHRSPAGRARCRAIQPRAASDRRDGLPADELAARRRFSPSSRLAPASG